MKPPLRLWPWYSSEATRRVEKRVRVGFNLGDHVADDDVLELEEAARLALAPAGYRALSFSSGTSALFASYHALGLAGKLVLAPSYTFRATVTPLLAVGAKVRFYDVNFANGRTTWASFRERDLAAADALVVSHMHGLLNDSEQLNALAAAYDLRVVADCSHAHGAYDDRDARAGSGADVAVYSLGTTKLVTGGLGGVAFFRDNDTYRAAVLLGQLKWRALRDVPDDPNASVGRGFHHRINPLAAILATDHLTRLDNILAAKQGCVDQVAEVVAEEAPWLTPVRPAYPGHRQGLYKLHLRLCDPSRRCEVLTQLRRVGVRARVPARALHLEPGLAEIAADSPDLLGTEGYLASALELDGLDLHDLDQLPIVTEKLAMGLRSAARCAI